MHSIGCVKVGSNTETKKKVAIAYGVFYSSEFLDVPCLRMRALF